MRMLGLGRSSILNLADLGETAAAALRPARGVRGRDIERLVEQRRSASAREAGLFRLTPPDRAE
jgi:hypothetical protein